MKLLNMNKFLITTALVFGFIAFGYSQQLVYTPKNPNFGGVYLNYSWLLSSAQAQNKFKVEEDDPFAQQTQLEQIQEDLNSSVLREISNSFLDSQLDDGLKPGVFTVGSLVLDVFETRNGLVVNILDTNNGDQTQIVVPN